ncbi:hypothetical protein TUMEXPCC7403_04015 [Tumidithrix helvetica PCC 7403]|uniref:PEP-CTERM sorting domain-containing protein n=1 Tax=Tumidithrix helvetica TaxID=3457545 RepID=UPI003CB337D3
MKSNKFVSMSLGTVAALACISAPLTASAATLTFDDLPNSSGGSPIPNGYNGFTWNNFYEVNGLSNIYTPPNSTGYQAGVVSPNNVIFNGFANPASLSSATPFTFNSAYFTAAWNDGLQIDVKGFLGSTQLFATTIAPSATAPTLFTFDWAGIDTLSFVSYGGTQHQGYIGNGTHFALDNLTYNEKTRAVPVPGVVFGVVAAGALFSRRLLKERSAKAVA